MKTKTLLLTAMATFGMTIATMAQNVPNYVPTNGLVGWWPFNGNASDASGNGNNGTVNGANLTADRFGFSNHAFDFNGVDNYIEVQHNLSLTFSNELSVSFWLNVPDLTFNASGSPERNPIGKQINASNSGIQFETNDVTNTPGSPQFYLNDGSSVAQYQDNNTIALNSWVHLVGTYNGTTLTLYSNNIVLGNNVNNLNLNSITQNLFFGKEGLIGRYFKGKLDDIGIWNRVLTQQEVTDLYNASNCAINTTITPQSNSIATGSTATFNATTTDPSPSYVWQSDFGQGYVTLNDFGNYSGVNSATLNIANVQLSEHNQPIRVITTSGNCIDTSNIAIINIADTCIATITDTTFITVTDTLIINTTITSLNPLNKHNASKLIRPNTTTIKKLS